jgi:hypothetical protein
MTETTSGPRLGWRARQRPEPGFAHALAAGAGVFAVIAVGGLVSELTSGDPTAPGVLLNLALAVAAFAAALRLSGPIRSMGTTVLVLTVPTIFFFAFFGGGDRGTGSIRGLLLLSTATFLVLYLVSWTKGRAVLLAFALLFVATWILVEVGNGSSGASRVMPFQSQISSQTGTGFTTTGDDSSRDVEIAALVVGLAMLGSAALLDRRELAGAATPFIVVGAIFALIGALGLASNESTVLGGLIAAAIGAGIGIVGGLGDDRRGSTWIGVIIVVIGLIAVIADLASGDTLGLVGLAAAVAIALAVGAVLLAPRLHEHVDGDRSN